jgi:hypothetical protein
VVETTCRRVGRWQATCAVHRQAEPRVLMHVPASAARHAAGRTCPTLHLRGEGCLACRGISPRSTPGVPALQLPSK